MTLSLPLILVANILLFNEVTSFAPNEIRTFESCKRAPPKYDMLVFAQTWPQTACWVINEKWEYQNCSPCNYTRTWSTSWTVHGLWPSNRNGDHPFYCNESKKFDEKLLGVDLLAILNVKWPTFNLQSNNVAFWKHEWDKHGTCALDIQSTNNVPKYFSKTLELMDAYNMGNILQMSGIVPGSRYMYKIDDIVRAIEGFLGVHVTLSCAEDKKNQETYLDQIYICFDKEFRLINCDTTTTIDCNDKNQLFIYPEILKPCKEI